MGGYGNVVKCARSLRGCGVGEATLNNNSGQRTNERTFEQTSELVYMSRTLSRTLYLVGDGLSAQRADVEVGVDVTQLVADERAHAVELALHILTAQGPRTATGTGAGAR